MIWLLVPFAVVLVGLTWALWGTGPPPPEPGRHSAKPPRPDWRPAWMPDEWWDKG